MLAALWQLELDDADDALLLLDQVVDQLLSQAAREHADERFKQLPELDDTRNVRAMTHAKVKNDRVDAQMLAKLLAAGMLPGTWVCDEQPKGAAPPVRQALAACARPHQGAQPGPRDRD